VNNRKLSFKKTIIKTFEAITIHFSEDYSNVKTMTICTIYLLEASGREFNCKVLYHIMLLHAVFDYFEANHDICALCIQELFVVLLYML